jgi:taurine transport system ATP-binding protein
MADLVCEDLNMTFTNPQTGGVVHALKDINFTLKKGELLSVLGPSGCGKTTLAEYRGRLSERHVRCCADWVTM